MSKEAEELFCYHEQDEDSLISQCYYVQLMKGGVFFSSNSILPIMLCMKTNKHAYVCRVQSVCLFIYFKQRSAEPWSPSNKAKVISEAAKNRERWRALEKGYILQWKDTAQNRIECHCNNVPQTSPTSSQNDVQLL